MKILMVNKFHYIKGGSETYYFALKRLLESMGHTVIDFSMQDDKNFESPYSEYFVDHVDYNGGGGGLKNKIKMAGKIIYSREAKRKFEALVKETQPDLIHLHIFQHQISPSILDVVKKLKIPTVYTAHDLKMVCPNYKMMHHGHLCEECKGGKYWHCAKNRCVKESLSKSVINTVEGYFHKWRRSYNVIGCIMTPSDFYRRKFIESGVEEQRVLHVPNFLDREAPQVEPIPNSKEYYLYFGRLSEEKGIQTLMQVMVEKGLPLYIVGTGPLKEELEAKVTENGWDNIRLLGFRQGKELTDLVGNAKAVVLPSEWYENGPFSAIEALQMSRPIIGADIGGIPELVRHNGYLFESGSVASLGEAIDKMEALDSAAYEAMEKASYALFCETYTTEAHLPLLRQAYGRVGVEI